MPKNVRRRTVVVDKNGTPLRHLADVQHGPITWTRSQPGTWSIAMSGNAEDSRKFFTNSPIPLNSDRQAWGQQNVSAWEEGYDPFTEVQLWRGDRLLTWGPSHTVSMESDTVSVSGGDASYYLQRRTIGPAKTLNLLENGDLTKGGDGWFVSVFRGWGNPVSGNRADSRIDRVRLPFDNRKWGWKIQDRTPLYGALDNDLSLNDPRNVLFIRRGIIYLTGGSLGNPPTGTAFEQAVISIYVNRNYIQGIETTEDSRAFISGMAAIAYELFRPGNALPNIDWVCRGADWAASSNLDEEQLDARRRAIESGQFWGTYGISNQTQANAFAYGIIIANDTLHKSNPNAAADAILGDLGEIPPPEIEFAPTYPTAQAFFAINAQKAATKLTFSCWIQVEELISPGDGDQSIFIGLFPRNATKLEELIDVRFSSFDKDHPVGQKVRHEVTIDVPAGQFVWGVASVRTCKGVSYAWDLQLEWEGGLINVDEEKAEIERRLVDHLAGNRNGPWLPAYVHPLWPFHGDDNYNKSNVNVNHNIKNTGYNLTRIYRFGDGGSGLDSITALAEDDDTSGWRMLNTPTERTFTTMRNMGVAWQFPLRSTHAGGNLTAFSWQYMGEQAANVVTVDSSYPGSRLQGYASESSFFANDVTIEDSLRAPEDLGEDLVQPYAETHLRKVKRPLTLSVALPADPYFDMGIHVGLLVPVTIYHSAIQVVGFFRIQSMTLTPDDFLEISLVYGDFPNTPMT